MTSSSEVPAPSENFYFIPGELILYGVRLNAHSGLAPPESGFINIAPQSPFGLANGGGFQGDLTLRLTLFRGGVELKENEAVIAAVYGYGFEGHCYRFDRPRMFLFEHASANPRGGDEEAQGCGYGNFVPPYHMWRIRMETLLLELGTSTGSARELILDANLPGKRSPNTYEGHMRLAHRGRGGMGGPGAG